MRGAALPLLAWGALLAVLMALNWVWTGDAIQVGTFGFSVAVVWGCGLALIGTGHRLALRPGPPEASAGADAVPTASLGAVLAALGVATIVFGLAFGRFLVFFGAGLLIVSAGLLERERRAQRRSWLARERGAQERPLPERERG